MRLFKNPLSTIVGLTILCGSPVLSQKLNYGVTAGINVAGFSLQSRQFGEGLENIWKPVMVSQVGGFVEKTLNKAFSLQTELLFSVRNSNLSVSQPLNYNLSVPLIVNYRPWKRLTFEAGPNILFSKDPKIINLTFLGGCRVQVSPTLSAGLRYIDGLGPMSRISLGTDDKGKVGNTNFTYFRNVQLMVSYQISKH